MSSANRYSFAFSIWLSTPLIYFSYLVALASTSTIMLNRSRMSRHLCLILDLSGGNTHFFTVKNTISYRFFIDGLFLSSFISYYFNEKSFFCQGCLAILTIAKCIATSMSFPLLPSPLLAPFTYLHLNNSLNLVLILIFLFSELLQHFWPWWPP